MKEKQSFSLSHTHSGLPVQATMAIIPYIP